MAIVELIGATTTKTGLKVECALDERTYAKGLKVSDAEMKSLDITGDAFHPEWNYTIKREVPWDFVAAIVRGILRWRASHRSIVEPVDRVRADAGDNVCLGLDVVEGGGSYVAAELEPAIVEVAATSVPTPVGIADGVARSLLHGTFARSAARCARTPHLCRTCCPLFPG